MSRKKKSLPKESARDEQTEDNEHVDKLQIKGALNQNVQKDIIVETNIDKQRRLTEALQDRVRGKFKAIKGEGTTDLRDSSSSLQQFAYLRQNKSSTVQENSAAQEDFFPTKQESYTEGYQTNFENEVPLDEGFEFFTSNFEDYSKLKDTDQADDMKSITDTLQNNCDLNEQTPLLNHIQDILLPELLEVKPPEYECNNLGKGRHCNQLFVPRSSPGLHQSGALACP